MPRHLALGLSTALVVLALGLSACVPLLPDTDTALPTPSIQPAGPLPAGVKEAQRPYYFPEKPITVLVGFERGTPPDTAARLLAARLEGLVEQPVVVANYPGGDGVEAWTRLKQAKADGHVIGAIASPRFPLVTLTSPGEASLTTRDFAPLANQLQEPIAIFVRQWSPFQSVDGFISAAQAQADRISLSVSSRTASGRVAAADFQRKVDLKLRVTQFATTNDTLEAALSGQADVAFCRISATAPSVASGQGRLLAVLDQTRSKQYPDVPTLREEGIDLVSYFSLGYAAPKATSQDIVDYLAWALYLAASDPGYQLQMKEAGLSARFLGAQPYWTQLAAETDRLRHYLASVGGDTGTEVRPTVRGSSPNR